MKFSNELEALINAAIADGMITPDEQAALLKRALLSGANPKEVEAEINSRLAQMKAAAPAVPPVPPTAAQPAKPKANIHDLDNLIEEYLTDGIISDKERQVLLRKAQALGLDTDEVDLYIDAQQQKADQKVDAAVSRKRGSACPYCGGSIPQLTDKCPHCGQNITAEASDDLQEIFDHLEDALVKFKSGEDIDKSKAEVERYVRKAKMYYENNPKVKRLLEEIAIESAKTEEEAKKNARNKAVFSILAKGGKKLYIPIVVILCIIGYVKYSDYQDEKFNQLWEEGRIEEEAKDQQLLETVQKTADDVNKCLDKKDLAGAARALTMCPIAYLGVSNNEGTALYKSLVANVVDAYLDKGQKRKAQDFVISCSAKCNGGRCGLSDLFQKLGADENYRFKFEEGYEKY